MSCQDVCVYMDSDQPNEFGRQATRKARKPHKCCECGDTIAVGDSYDYATGKTDGDFWSVETCATCAEIRKVFCCDGWVYTMLWEEIREQLFPYWDAMKAIDCLAKLSTEKAVAKMQAEYADYRENNP